MHRNTKTKDCQQLKLDDLNLDFKIIEYNGAKNKSKFKHSCGNEFYMRFDHVLNRKRCPDCDGRKRTLERFQDESNKRHNEEYLILEFENGNSEVKIKHKVCDKEFLQTGFRHLRGDRCPHCYRNKKYTKEDIIKISFDKYHGEYELLSDEIHYDKKCLIRHNCGYEYNQRICSHLRGSKCPKCAGNAPHTLESVQEKSNEIHNNEYEILSDPKGSLSKVKILHKLCGREFEQVISYHISGHKCIFCTQSNGEKIIEVYLFNNKIKFEKQKTFMGCKYKKKLRFDFYLPEIKSCLEFDGYQHFYPVNYFGGKKAFELQKIKDGIKNKYCEDNNIKLIRIKYDDDKESIISKINSLID